MGVAKSVEIPSQKDIYHKLISRLLKKSLHDIHSCNVVFSSKSDTLTDDSIKDAIKKAQSNYTNTAKNRGHRIPQYHNINPRIGEPKNHIELQIIDYILWCVSRFVNFNEDGYFEAIKDKISLINDIHDTEVNVKTGRYYAKPLNDFTIKFTENIRRRLEQDSI